MQDLGVSGQAQTGMHRDYTKTLKELTRTIELCGRALRWCVALEQIGVYPRVLVFNQRSGPMLWLSARVLGVGKLGEIQKILGLALTDVRKFEEYTTYRHDSSEVCVVIECDAWDVNASRSPSAVAQSSVRS